MSEENKTGQDQTQNDQTEEKTSETQTQEPVQELSTPEKIDKVLEDNGLLEDYKQIKGKEFSRLYNDGKKKALKDMQSIGIEADDYDTAINTIKGYLSKDNTEAKSEENDGEVESLRDKLKEAQTAREKLQNELQQTRRNQTVSQESNKAFSQLQSDGELKLPQKQIETLFNADFEISEENGQLYAIKPNGEPDLDDMGNRKSLSQSIIDYSKSQGLVTPKKQGTGGGTGDSTTDKPKKSEWRRLIRKTDPASEEKAAIMYNLAKELGWASE